MRNLEATIAEYRQKMEERKKVLISLQNTIVAREEIKPIIENLKLDNRKEEHLRFWHGKNHPMGRRASGVTPIYLGEEKDENSFIVPKKIRAMMEVAQKDYESKRDFLAALDKVRFTWTLNPFRTFFRDKLTARVYSEKNIETLNVSNRPTN